MLKKSGAGASDFFGLINKKLKFSTVKLFITCGLSQVVPGKFLKSIFLLSLYGKSQVPPELQLQPRKCHQP